MQWALAWSVIAGSTAVTLVALQWFHRAAPTPTDVRANEGAEFIGIVLQLVVVTALVRFGFAIGTWVQAFREGRVRDDVRDDA